ncbi:MAG: glycosyltransferase family 2 protein [Ferruginibacter sp.]
MEKVIAVIVTYNRQKLLTECITALRNQTRAIDKILVINNGSTDSTESWLKTQADIEFITQPNVGGAGGFNKAIKTGFEKGYSWIWCMDDDGYPKSDALEKLLDAEDGTLRLLNCAVINKNDKDSFVWKTGKTTKRSEVTEKYIDGFGHPFNGTLLHRKIIERVGVPKQHFFLWGDETEYFYRITKTNNIPVRTITDSVHYHPPTAFSYKTDWNYQNDWKLYFCIRNRFHIQKAKFNNKFIALVHYCCFIAAFAGLVLFFQKTDRLKKLNFMMWPLADALRNDFSATPATILNKLRSQSQSSSWPIPFRSYIAIMRQNWINNSQHSNANRTAA